MAPRFHLFLERGFWSETACRRLREISKTTRSEEAGIYSEGKLSVDGRFRKTARVLLDRPLSDEIHGSLLEIKPRLENYFDISLSGLQPFQFLQYRPGDYFRTHQDEKRPPSETTRKVSFIVFLNSESSESETGFAGGDVVFYENMAHNLADDGVHIPAEEGLLLAFSSYLLHEVREVRNGLRYSIVSWFF
jgi:predicted 2-oxoglutarate/Fe(II)-dependent dioxygenase YbiX